MFIRDMNGHTGGANGCIATQTPHRESYGRGPDEHTDREPREEPGPRSRRNRFCRTLGSTRCNPLQIEHDPPSGGSAVIRVFCQAFANHVIERWR